MHIKSPAPLPKIEVLKSLFEYRGGLLLWREKPDKHFQDPAYQRSWNTKFAGKPVGTVRPDGYVSTFIEGRRRLVHRIVYYLAHGYCPDKIDHIDGNPSNNRVENLRGATDSENCWNMSLSSRNTSGFKGVTWHKRDKRWQAQVKVRNRVHHLGQYRDVEDAKAAVIEHRRIHHGAYANDG